MIKIGINIQLSKILLKCEAVSMIHFFLLVGMETVEPAGPRDFLFYNFKGHCSTMRPSVQQSKLTTNKRTYYVCVGL